VHVGGRRINVRLSKKEFDLLLYLFGKAGQTCSREELSDALWGWVEAGGKVVPRYDDHMLHALVHRLRGKLARAGVDLGQYLTSISGVGYRLDTTPRAANGISLADIDGARNRASWAMWAAGAGGLILGVALLGIALLLR
jgi:DNA-binding winged helix-turn-helix (wHTH) protein